jgi:hypothetical protein
MTDTHYAVMADGNLGTSSIVNLTLRHATGLMRIWRMRMPESQAVYVLDMDTMEKIAEG